MLTLDEIEAAKQAHAIVAVRPLVPWVPIPRVFFVSPELLDAMEVGGAQPATRDRYQSLRADIDHFVSGGFINWGLMKWLDPKNHEIWELRSVRPRPSLRVFGRFAQPNVFVGTHLAERRSLKGKWSLEFELEKLRAEEIWNRIFNASAPFSAPDYEGYITENALRGTIT